MGTCRSSASLALASSLGSTQSGAPLASASTSPGAEQFLVMSLYRLGFAFESCVLANAVYFPIWRDSVCTAYQVPEALSKNSHRAAKFLTKPVSQFKLARIALCRRKLEPTTRFSDSMCSANPVSSAGGVEGR